MIIIDDFEFASKRLSGLPLQIERSWKQGDTISIALPTVYKITKWLLRPRSLFILILSVLYMAWVHTYFTCAFSIDIGRRRCSCEMRLIESLHCTFYIYYIWNSALHSRTKRPIGRAGTPGQIKFGAMKASGSPSASARSYPLRTRTFQICMRK